MRRTLIRSAAFVRAAKQLVKRQPQSAEPMRVALERLEEDAADPRLKTHKLKGDLADSWACSVSRDLRIVFRIVDHDGAEAILLETVGSHDEVY